MSRKTTYKILEFLGGKKWKLISRSYAWNLALFRARAISRNYKNQIIAAERISKFASTFVMFKNGKIIHQETNRIV